MNKLSLLTGALDLVVSAGAGAAVGNIIKASIPVTATKLNRFTIGVGSVALAAASGQFASNYAQGQLAQTAEQLKTLKNAVHPEPIVVPERVREAAETVQLKALDVTETVKDKASETVERTKAATDAFGRPVSTD